jgi:branched-subunit amino acid aminotransferase/4-amino-4-deoxychorismate lyase
MITITGMKAYKDKKGRIRLFRPDMNMNRLLRSAKRFCLPVHNDLHIGVDDD